MYRIMIVDDEPTALNMLRMIIEKKSDSFQVIETAYSGQEALKKVKICHPDVLFTDIRMPGMDGLTLIEKIKQENIDLESVVISGYQDFEYVKTAIHFGVSDYILKPIVPQELCELLKKIEIRLDKKYYSYRNQLMRKLVNDLTVNQNDLKRFFVHEYFYGAIVRRNGLPMRFSDRTQKEVFSDLHELILAYGRDEQETLYLCPKELFSGDNYIELLKKHIGKEQPDAAYVTTIIGQNPVRAEQLGELIRELYRALDSLIILGKSQTILLKENKQKEKKEEQDFGYLSRLEFLAKNKKYESLQKEIEALIREWGKEEHPQIWMEGRLRQICYLLQRYEAGNPDYRECEFLLDEAFANVENADQLAMSIGDIFFKDKKEETSGMAKIDTEKYFDKIKGYIQAHMSEPLSLQKVSRDMGVSQTYLSKMFRKYEDSSFNNYLTLLRMEKAKKLFREEEKLFVKDVAERVGYKDQFYFSRIFFAYTGVRPSEYMEQNH